MSVFHYRTAVIVAEDLDQLGNEYDRMIRLLESENGAIEEALEPQLLSDGPNSGKWVRVVHYAKPAKYL